MLSPEDASSQQPPPADPHAPLPARTPDDEARAAEIARRWPGLDAEAELPGVPLSRRPRHIAFIMDGNGRWAQQRGEPRVAGHRAGAERVGEIIEAAARMGVECVTMYSFSSENWRRPADEVEALMRLCVDYCTHRLDELLKNRVRVRVIGRREALPAEVREAVAAVEERTASLSGITACMALNYGSRAEIVDAARALAADAAAKRLDPADIDERAVSSRLYTAGLPDVDLLIRTAGEMRVSNYLLWQISYAELWVTERCWPDFDSAALGEAVRDYASRRRTFGALPG